MIECIMGIYEADKSVFFEKNVSNGDIIYDIGAHAGYYTLLASILVGKEGKVVSFEPSPPNFKYLQMHIKLNECENVIANEAAVSDFNGISKFKLGDDENRDNSYLGYLDEEGDIPVKTTTLDQFIAKNPELKPDCIKIDVEGAEFLVLKGATSMLSNYHPKLFLATHNDKVHKECIDLLKRLGYTIEFIKNMENEIFAYKDV